MKASETWFSAWFACAALLVLSCSSGSGAAPVTQTAPAKPIRSATQAMAELFPVGRHETRGVVRFRITEKGVMLRGKIEGLSNGNFGMSIHEKGDCSAPDAKSVGPYAKPLGQLEDVNADASGRAEFQRVEEKLKTLDGDEGVVGKALVIQAWPYDPKTDVKDVPFIACGVIRAE